MSTNNSGKNLKFYWDSVEKPVDQVSYDVDFAELDSTNSSTPSPSTDSLVSRAVRTLKVDAPLVKDLGTEIASGSLTAGQKYLVTLGTITENSITYAVGDIFESDGTGTVDASNKVKPLGDIFTGKTMGVSIGGTATDPVTAFSFQDAYGEFDTTNDQTTGDATEFIAGRTKRTSSIEIIQTKEDADKLVSSPSAQAVILTFDTSYTISGNAIFRKKTAVANSQGDMIKTTYELSWVGTVDLSDLTELLTPAVSTACAVIFAKGASTNKEVTGNAIILTRSIDVDVHSLAKVSYDMKWVGAVTEDELT